MKILATLLCILAMLPQLSFGQQKAQPIYSQVTITLNAGHTLQELATLGLELDHAQLSPTQAILIVSEQELAAIKAKGFTLKVLVPDVTADFLERNAADKAKSAGNPGKQSAQAETNPYCDNLLDRPVPVNWDYGTMGGHLTYEEALGHLDSMRAKYPTLITARAPIGSYTTWDGNNIFWLRINGRAATADTTQPEILYTALHHAREPLSLHQLIYFMWYLLENYESDTLVKNLVNKTQLYFVPILNPDSYIQNHLNLPNGGGMIRKNKRNNNDGTFGVDLNRNYPKNWGIDNAGSSPNTSSQVYRGPSAASEPETQALIYFCKQHRFKICLNNHSFSNVLIYPTDRLKGTQTNDSVTFRSFGRALTKESHFYSASTIESLGYTTNGGSDEYMYFPDEGKKSIIAYTPELGTASEDGFWPVESRILPLCKRTLFQNIVAAQGLHPFVTFKDSTGLFFRAGYGGNASAQRIKYKLTRTGVNAAAQTFTVRFIPAGLGHTNTTVLEKRYTISALNQTINDSILVPAPALGAATGEKLAYQVEIDNGLFKTQEFIYHYTGIPQSSAALYDGCDVLQNWRMVSGQPGFVISTTNKVEGSGALSDNFSALAPGQSIIRTIRRKQPFVLPGATVVAAELSMQVQYVLNRTREGVALRLTTDTTTWTTSCTDATEYAASPQRQFLLIDGVEDAPVWAGNKPHWSQEVVNLENLLDNPSPAGTLVYMELLQATIPAETSTGFTIDAVRVRYVVPGIVTALDERRGLQAFAAWPNPVADYMEVQVLGTEPVQVYDAHGRLLALPPLPSANAGYVRLSTQNLAPGLYIVRRGTQQVRVVK